MSAYEDVCNYFENAARVIDLSSNMKKLLLTPEREVKVQVAMKNGQRRHCYVCRLPNSAQ